MAKATPAKLGVPKPSLKSPAGTKRKLDVPAAKDMPRALKPLPTPRIKQERKDCDICAESKTAIDFNFPKLSTCDHGATVCRDCFKKHFVTKVQDKQEVGWKACTCPLCDTAVPEDEAKRVVPRTIQAEINKIVKKAEKESHHNFLWCPAPNCDHGQVQKLTKKAWVTCSRCKTKICFAHRVRWHEGVSCAEFDDNANHDDAARKNLAEIRRTTKPCPYCKIRVKKEGGCNHMRCGKCQKNWLWNDVPFDGETQGTAAEVAGGPQIAQPLPPDQRAAIHQVHAFENARIDGRGQVTGQADPEAGAAATVQATIHLHLAQLRALGAATAAALRRLHPRPAGRPEARPAGRQFQQANAAAEQTIAELAPITPQPSLVSVANRPTPRAPTTRRQRPLAAPRGRVQASSSARRHVQRRRVDSGLAGTGQTAQERSGRSPPIRPRQTRHQTRTTIDLTGDSDDGGNNVVEEWDENVTVISDAENDGE